MTKEEKELLLKDICARFPYELVINIGDRDIKLDSKHQSIGILYPEDCSDEFNERNNNSAFYITISGCYYGKPYLRPLSSMTDEESKEYNILLTTGQCSKLVDYLDRKMFDHRGLIPMSLALEAKEGMYNN